MSRTDPPWVRFDVASGKQVKSHSIRFNTGFCKGLCNNLGVKMSPYAYILGFRRCSYCEVFFDIEDDFCPCCHMRLRTKPRKGSHRNKFYDMLGIKVKRY
jgi:hypothetical protein